MRSPPHFPVLRVNSTHVQRVDVRRFAKENAFYIDRGVYGPGTFLIDSLGIRHDVMRCELVRRSWNLLDLIDKHPWFYVRLELGQQKPLTLENAKGILEKLISEKRWYRQSHESKGEFLAWFDKIASFSELVASISLYGGWCGRNK